MEDGSWTSQNVSHHLQWQDDRQRQQDWGRHALYVSDRLICYMYIKLWYANIGLVDRLRLVCYTTRPLEWSGGVAGSMLCLLTVVGEEDKPSTSQNIESQSSSRNQWFKLWNIIQFLFQFKFHISFLKWFSFSCSFSFMLHFSVSVLFQFQFQFLFYRQHWQQDGLDGRFVSSTRHGHQCDRLSRI